MTFSLWFIGICSAMAVLSMCAAMHINARVTQRLAEVVKHRRHFDAVLGKGRVWPMTATCYYSWVISNGTTDTFISKVAYETATQAGYAGYVTWRDWFRNEAAQRGIRGLDIFVQKFTLKTEDEDSGFAKVDFNDGDIGGSSPPGGEGAVSGISDPVIMSNTGAPLDDPGTSVGGPVETARPG